MKRLLLLCSAVLLLAACTQENDFGNNPTYKVDYSGVEVTESTLSVEQAMNNMNFVYRNFEGKDHKIRKIRKVEMLTTGNLRPSSLTRSGLGEDAEDQPLAYVVNFEEEAGYAILAADAQLPPIIMLGDEGNFSTQNYLDFLQRTETRSGGTDFDPSNVQDLQYAIVTNSLSFPGINPSDRPTPMEGRDTTILVKCWPLLKTKWEQDSPYNHYAPIIDGKKCPAGCAPIACAQVIAALAYHQNLRTNFTASDTHGGPFTTDLLHINRIISADTTRYYSWQTTPGALAVANLIRAVGAHIGTNYSPMSSRAPSQRVAALLTQLGCKNIVFTNEFTNEDIYDMIVNNFLPVYMQASSLTPDEEENACHAFVLDGWLAMEYEKFVIIPPYGIPPTIDINRIQFDLVHVNFGYGGDCDGYYIPGAFDMTETEFDEWADEGDYASDIMSRNYNFDIWQIFFNY